MFVGFSFGRVENSKKLYILPNCLKKYNNFYFRKKDLVE